MDLFFSKNKNKFSKNKISLNTSAILNKDHLLLSLISYNQSTLSVLMKSLGKYYYIYNGTLLSMYCTYIRSLRKTFIPWILANKLTSLLHNGHYNLYMGYYNLRHRRVQSKYNNYFSFLIRFSWSSKFYKSARIKRWLTKKYTNNLWR